MKIYFKLIVLSLFIHNTSYNQSLEVKVTNPSNLDRYSETISINLIGLCQLFPEINKKNIKVFESSKEIVSQLIDENSDGIFENLIFQSNFKPKESKKITLKFDNQKLAAYKTLVDGRFVLPRQDFAWENDRIAFRVYGSVLAGDVKNGIDVWTKRVRYPVIEKWYKGEEQIPKVSYHTDHGEGADYFSVGRSLGCGGSGIILNKNLFQEGLFSNYRVISNGPIRVSFELYYPRWEIDTNKFLEVKRITLDAGNNLNKIEEYFISNSEIGVLNLALGLVKRKNTTVIQNTEQGWMTLWGLTTDDPSIGYLGTAVVLGSNYKSLKNENKENWLLTTNLERNKSITYYSGAGWTKSGDFQTEKDWISYIEKFVRLLNEPVILQISKNK